MEHHSINPGDDQESGWTDYFEDFWNNNQQNSDHSSFSCGSSLISNAATTPGTAWKSSHDHHRVFPKKTRTKQICQQDDSLEDTASSPVDAHKVVDDWKSNNMNPSKREDQAAHTSLGKESAENCSDIHTEDESKLNFHDNNNDCKDLSNRGLCLVPFSMFVNYPG